MARKRHSFFFRIQSFLKLKESRHKLLFFIELKNQNKIKNITYYLLLFVTVFLIIGILPVTTRVNAGDLVVQSLQKPSETVQDGKEKDETGQFSIKNLEQAVKAFRASKNNLKLSMTLSNLSLAYQQQGQWQKADEAITESQEVLKSISSNSRDKRKLLAHALEVEGKLKLSIGKTEEALRLWQKAYTKFDEVGDKTGKIRTHIHQSLALQELGFYLQAFKILEASIKSNQFLQIQSEPLKATAYRVLGNVLRVVGYTEDDKKELENYLPFLKQEINKQSLDDIKISQQQSLKDSKLELSQRFLLESLNLSKKEKSETLLSLGNIMQEAYYRSKNAYDRLNTQSNDPKVQLRFKDDAIFYYEQAQEEAIKVNLPIISIQAELNKLSLLIDVSQTKIESKSDINTVKNQLERSINNINKLEEEIKKLPISQTTVYTRIKLAQSLMKHYIAKVKPQEGEFFKQYLEGFEKSQEIEKILLDSIKMARNDLKDQRVEAYAIGNLARLYETFATDEALYKAQLLTKEALKVAESIQVPEISYELEWQLGRVLRKQGEIYKNQKNLEQSRKKIEQAITAYQVAVKTIKDIHKDYLVGLKNRDASFSFRDKVEPVYLELVDLYLSSATDSDNKTVTKKPEDNSSADIIFNEDYLNNSLEVVEDLQVLELENFLRCSLQNNTSVAINKITDNKYSKTAVIYPILLDKRLEVLVKLPTQERPIRRTYEIPNPQQVKEVVEQLQQDIRDSEKIEKNMPQPIPESSRQLYNWLFKQNNKQQITIEDQLKNDIETLIFVLGSGSGALRNLPVAALHDGKTYLLEKYNLALNPVPKLLKSKPFNKDNFKLLAAGVFAPNLDPNAEPDSPSNKEYNKLLPGVERQLKKIPKLVSNSKVLRNEEFTFNSLKNVINSEPFEVVHLATHGQFSNNFDASFVLGFHERLNLNQLSLLLNNREENRPEPIQLLIFNACQTAFGDTREVLGIAGVAVRSGARSTIASVFNADDEFASQLMIAFYENLPKPGITISKALRLAQLQLLNNKDSKLYQWATFVLVGNWR